MRFLYILDMYPICDILDILSFYPLSGIFSSICFFNSLFFIQQYVVNIFPYYSSVMSPKVYKSLHCMNVLYNVLCWTNI